MFEEKEESRSIYLTFDDGPHSKFTPRVLDVLRCQGLKATFFVVGSKLKVGPLAELVALAASEGHTVGNHTFSHPDLTTCSEGRIREEIGATRSTGPL